MAARRTDYSTLRDTSSGIRQIKGDRFFILSMLLRLLKLNEGDARKEEGMGGFTQYRRNPLTADVLFFYNNTA